MTRSSLKNLEAQKATFVAATLALTAILTGCGGMSNTAASGPQLIQGAALHGAAYGGRQPIAGATLYLYAASTTSSYTSPVANTNLLPTNTTTNPDGTFNINQPVHMHRGADDVHGRSRRQYRGGHQPAGRG